MYVAVHTSGTIKNCPNLKETAQLHLWCGSWVLIATFSYDVCVMILVRIS